MIFHIAVAACWRGKDTCCTSASGAATMESFHRMCAICFIFICSIKFDFEKRSSKRIAGRASVIFQITRTVRHCYGNNGRNTGQSPAACLQPIHCSVLQKTQIKATDGVCPRHLWILMRQGNAVLPVWNCGLCLPISPKNCSARFLIQICIFCEGLIYFRTDIIMGGKRILKIISVMTRRFSMCFILPKSP